MTSPSDAAAIDPADAEQGRAARRMVPKPAAVVRFEAALARALPVHPNVVSLIKLVVVTPAMLLALRQVDVLPLGSVVVSVLFLAFALLDYLDGVVARGRGLVSNFGRVLDRVTDYPLLIVLSYFCLDVLPRGLVLAKVGIDVLLIALYLGGRGSTENRLRTTLSYTTLLALLFLSQGWLPHFFVPQVVQALLWLSIGFSVTVALYNLGALQKRFIADTISAGNLACGGVSMWFASQQRFDVSMVFLLLGAAFDGFDGAAARKWGGTRWGVYSDDVADGVNYGIAPGVAIFFALRGLEGALIGAAYSIFTISRLVYFTLNKADSDPEYFSGAPSTVGAMTTMCALILFPEQPALVGLLVGVACTQMVSFDARYRHLARALGKQRRTLAGALAYVFLVIIGGVFWGKQLAVALVLIANLGYGFLPVVASFRRVGGRGADA